MTIVPQICNNFDKQPNPYVRDLRWVMILNNDEIYWQDDDDNQFTEPSAWLRLKQYLDLHNALGHNYFVKRILLEFRGHMEIIEVEDDVEGLFFRKAVGKDWGSDFAQDYYLFGKIRKGILGVDVWMVPELILQRSENRTNIEEHLNHMIVRNAKIQE